MLRVVHHGFKGLPHARREKRVQLFPQLGVLQHGDWVAFHNAGSNTPSQHMRSQLINCCNTASARYQLMHYQQNLFRLCWRHVSIAARLSMLFAFLQVGLKIPSLADNEGSCVTQSVDGELVKLLRKYWPGILPMQLPYALNSMSCCCC